MYKSCGTFSNRFFPTVQVGKNTVLLEYFQNRGRHPVDWMPAGILIASNRDRRTVRRRFRCGCERPIFGKFDPRRIFSRRKRPENAQAEQQQRDGDDAEHMQFICLSGYQGIHGHRPGAAVDEGDGMFTRSKAGHRTHHLLGLARACGG